jgi:ferredoxin
MPEIFIGEEGPFEVVAGRRLVLAIEDHGVDIGHRCGGKARCTTCRVHVTQGEPENMTRAEYRKLSERELLGEVRLACQIVVDRPMRVQPLMRVRDMGWSDPGPTPKEDVEPEARWFSRDELEEER